MIASLVATLVASGTVAAGAQTRVELGPFAGVFVPLSSFEGNLGPVVHQVAVAGGGEAHLWIGEHFGLVAQLGASPSDVRKTETRATGFGVAPASVRWLSAALAWRIAPLDLANDLRFRAGAGFVQHRGAAFARYDFPQAVTGLLGIEATWPLRAAVRVLAGIDGYVYPHRLTDTLGVQYRERLQVNVVAKIGVLWVPAGDGEPR